MVTLFSYAFAAKQFSSCSCLYSFNGYLDSYIQHFLYLCSFGNVIITLYLAGEFMWCQCSLSSTATLLKWNSFSATCSISHYHQTSKFSWEFSTAYFLFKELKRYDSLLLFQSYLQMLTSKDTNFIGYTFKKSDILKSLESSGTRFMGLINFSSQCIIPY